MLYWYKTTNNDAPIANLRARREYNTAEIELQKVEDLEPEMLLEEELCNAEQRMVAHVRAEKEREAAFRLERAQQQRQVCAYFTAGAQCLICH